jgi:hypothetical protein
MKENGIKKPTNNPRRKQRSYSWKTPLLRVGGLFGITGATKGLLAPHKRHERG